MLLELSTTEEEEVAVSSSGCASGMRGRLPLLDCLLSTTTPAERRGRRVEAAGAVCGREEEEEEETRGRTDSGCGASGVKVEASPLAVVPPEEEESAADPADGVRNAVSRWGSDHLKRHLAGRKPPTAGNILREGTTPPAWQNKAPSTCCRNSEHAVSEQI